MAEQAEIEELKAQLVEVQTQLAFQEDLLGQLNTALANQQQEIADLRRQGELLRDQYRELQQQLPDGVPVEKPPHY